MKKNKLHIKEELKELNADRLLSYKEMMQDIPEDYFKNLNENILHSINSEKTTQTKVFSIKKIFLPLSLAASLIFLLALPLFNKTNTLNWNQFSKTEFELYLEQNIEDFSLEEIASISNMSDFSILHNTAMSENELEEYLLEIDVLEDEIL